MELNPIRVTQPIVVEKSGSASNYAGKRRLEYTPLISQKNEDKKKYYSSLNYLI